MPPLFSSLQKRTSRIQDKKSLYFVFLLSKGARPEMTIRVRSPERALIAGKNLCEQMGLFS
jgi:hypothetical protein